MQPFQLSHNEISHTTYMYHQTHTATKHAWQKGAPGPQPLGAVVRRNAADETGLPPPRSVARERAQRPLATITPLQFSHRKESKSTLRLINN